MATTEHYDVIIIGTGAGGGTLAHTIAASGKRILLLERGNFLPREMENWTPAGLRRRPLHLAGDVVRRRRQGVPAAGALLRRRGHEALRRRAVPAAAAGLRRAAARRRRLARVAAQLRRLRALLHQGRMALPGARQPRRGPDRRTLVASSTRGRRCRTSPASRVDRRPDRRRATTRSHAPCGILLDEADRAEHMHPLHLVRRLPVPGAREGRRRDDRRAPDARPAERHAARRRRGDAARDRPVRPDRHRCRRVARRREETYEADIVVVPAGASNSAKSCCARPTTSTRTASRTAPTRSAATTCSTTARPSSRWRRNATTRCSRRRSGINDFYFGATTTGWPLGNIQMVGKSNAEAMKGEEPKLTKLAPHGASTTSPTTPSTSG